MRWLVNAGWRYGAGPGRMGPNDRREGRIRAVGYADLRCTIDKNGDFTTVPSGSSPRVAHLKPVDAATIAGTYWQRLNSRRPSGEIPFVAKVFNAMAGLDDFEQLGAFV